MASLKRVGVGRGIQCRVTALEFWGWLCNPVGTAFWLSGSIPEVCSFASLCIAAIAAVCKTVTLKHRWFESTTGHWSNG